MAKQPEPNPNKPEMPKEAQGKLSSLQDRANRKNIHNKKRIEQSITDKAMLDAKFSRLQAMAEDDFKNIEAARERGRKNK